MGTLPSETQLSGCGGVGGTCPDSHPSSRLRNSPNLAPSPHLWWLTKARSPTHVQTMLIDVPPSPLPEPRKSPASVMPPVPAVSGSKGKWQSSKRRGRGTINVAAKGMESLRGGGNYTTHTSGGDPLPKLTPWTLAGKGKGSNKRMYKIQGTPVSGCPSRAPPPKKMCVDARRVCTRADV